MNSYYSGWPYSEELYHHGTKGQQWGRRLYQYEDGSLTPLGRIHYGVGQAGKAVGRGAKALGNRIEQNYKRKHPEKMTDEELQAEINRQKKLNDLKEARRKYKEGSVSEKVSKIFWKAADVGTTALVNKTATKIGEGIGDKLLEKSGDKKIKELKDTKEILSLTSDIAELTKTANLARKESQAQEQAKKIAKKEEKEKRKEERKIGSKKAVDDYVKEIEVAEERKRRKELYGPGGKAYK